MLKADSIPSTKPRKRTLTARLLLADLGRQRALAVAEVARARRALADAMADLAEHDAVMAAVRNA